MSTRQETAHTLLAGVICALVGFTSSFAVVLAGLRAVGAGPAQAGSGLIVALVTMGLGSLLFSWRYRIPITMAWSTPGVALLAAGVAPAGGFAAAVGAFVLTGLLLSLTGLVRPFGELVQRIPTPLANAMLAGVLLMLCVAPFQALMRSPAAIAPVLVCWLVLLRLAPRLAVPGALLAAVVVLAVTGALGRLDQSHLAPALTPVLPRFDPATLLAITVPLFLVTMTSQNIPGTAVLAGFGYRTPWLPAMAYTGGTTAAGALLGGPGINLAAISAALAAGPEAGPDPNRRWLAGVSCGITHLLLAPLSGVVIAVAQVAPDGLLATIAGLALVGTFAASATAALAEPGSRLPAALTIVIAASGLSVAGIGAPFWALLGGLVLHAVLSPRRGRRDQ
ncbi:benzoate membrane transport protein [Propionibacteriaceae bacterium ES.041]|uniref:benzoate/H(+) symporter BenE family transporter n=1 Tax=Enemella evansiae TaxID=2016499 RepID=UPI000B96E1F4|nr:benzoate/H(+) symporter BenE family transporter [Enemella evansiae]OYN94409.1 benzoate transporter [Enemella evansiae]PFG66496.1 benzoate membrane transport protein [Propionibacteriaceae bacterium ES.041]